MTTPVDSAFDALEALAAESWSNLAIKKEVQHVRRMVQAERECLEKALAEIEARDTEARKQARLMLSEAKRARESALEMRSAVCGALGIRPGELVG